MERHRGRPYIESTRLRVLSETVAVHAQNRTRKFCHHRYILSSRRAVYNINLPSILLSNTSLFLNVCGRKEAELRRHISV